MGQAVSPEFELQFESRGVLTAAARESAVARLIQPSLGGELPDDEVKRRASLRIALVELHKHARRVGVLNQRECVVVNQRRVVVTFDVDDDGRRARCEGE